MATELVELDLEQCIRLLASHNIGRVALVDDGGFPVVFPVNFRLVDRDRQHWIAIRARPEGAIDHPGHQVALQLDEVDEVHHTGWSVLVRGTLETVDRTAADFAEHFDPGPWLDERDAWLVIEPAQITGRAVSGVEIDWAFSIEAYL